jgi:hypothetical protein
MAVGRGPLAGRAVELLAESQRAARKEARDVDVRMRRHQTALVFDDVAGAGPALDGDVPQTRVDGHVEAVERVGHAPSLSVNVW